MAKFHCSVLNGVTVNRENVIKWTLGCWAFAAKVDSVRNNLTHKIHYLNYAEKLNCVTIVAVAY